MKWLSLSLLFLGLFSRGRRHLFVRGLHLGKHFLNPSAEDIIFKAICVNLRQKRWDLLDRMSSRLTNSIVSRVFREFQSSPQVVLEFYDKIGWYRYVLDSLDCCGILVHVMVKSRKFDDALCLMKKLMITKGYSPLGILEVLITSNDMVFSSCAAYDALVRACIQIGATEDAYEVIKKLRVEGSQVSIHAWNNFLNHLLKLDEVARFQLVYKEMVSYGYFENVNTFNLIIFALCKECKLLEAVSVFYRMLKSGIMPNDVALNMLIDGACGIGDLDLAMKLVRKIGTMTKGSVNPDSISYNSLIKGFCKSGSVATAERFLDEMIKMGIEPNIRTYATLVDGYSRIGCLEEAFRLCNNMVKIDLVPNSVVYNSVIHCLFMEGEMKGASMFVADMIKRNIFLDKFTYSILVKGLCMNGHVNEALKWHKLILEKNLVEDAFAHNILINYLCRTKNIAGAKQILCNMFVRGFIPDLVTYGTIIDGYCKAGNLESALHVYNDMIKVEKNPNLVIYNVMLDCLCKTLSVDAGKLLVDALKSRDFFDVISFNTLLNGYCLVGNIDEAFIFLLNMRKEGISFNQVSYNILINFLCKHGLIQQAKKLMKLMIFEGLTPDSVTYTTLITHMSKKSCAKEVIELHDDMLLGGVIPDSQTYRGVVSPLTGGENADFTQLSTSD